MDTMYRDIGSPKFNETLAKEEFRLSEKHPGVYQEPYQILMRNWVSTNSIYDNILLYHGLGTGKTCTSISIAEGFKEFLEKNSRRVLVIVKNSNLQDNFINQLMSQCTRETYLTDKERSLMKNIGGDSKSVASRLFYEQNKEIKKQALKRIRSVYTFINYGKFVNDVNSGHIKDVNDTVVIVDEAHNITNNTVYTALHATLSRSYNYRLVLLSATPIADSPVEILDLSNLLNINTLDAQFPKDIVKAGLVDTFESPTGLKGGIVRLSDKALKLLEQRMLGKVSYIAENSETNPLVRVHGTILPGRNVQIVECQMSAYQYSVYKNALNIDKTQEQSLYKNSNDASTFVYPNDKFGAEGFAEHDSKSAVYKDLKTFSTKMHHIMLRIKENKGTHFIYSNFVTASGVAVVQNTLVASGYVHARTRNMEEKDSDYKRFVVLGREMSAEARERYRGIFNSRQNRNGRLIRVLVGSPIMAEGVTLKNVRNVHVLEPFWNMSRVNQVIGRAVRNHSHDDLPLDERIVNVYKYAAVYPKDDFYIDKEKYIVSYEKDKNNKIVERLLKTISVDCHALKEYNERMRRYEDGDPRCDYMSCKFECKLIPTQEVVPTSGLFIKDTKSYVMSTVRKAILDMFKVYFVWKLDDIIKGHDVKAVYTVLDDMVENMDVVTDMYGRKGFIINRYPFFIFNPFDKNVHDTLYSKMFDFESTEYLGEPVKKPEIVRNVNAVMSAKDIQFNNDLVKNNKYVGSYRKRGTTRSGDYGEDDGKFRLVVRQDNVEQDKRKVVTGMGIHSFKKKDLYRIAQELGLSTLEKTNKQVEQEIEDHLVSLGLVLR
jgi:superfamily II DNA or RNA helicase